jgi:predicted NACHT family NTPase
MRSHIISDNGGRLSVNHPFFIMVEKSEASEKKPEKDPLNDKIANIAVKFLMTGGIVGGGFGAFWSLFKDSDIPKAIASAVIGLGISYGAKLLQPINKGNEERLEKAGKAIDKRLDVVTNQIITQASGFEDRYLDCQMWDCQAVRSEGVPQYEGIFAPLLEEVFVPLVLGTDALAPGFRFEAGAIEPFADLNIWQFLAKAEKEPNFRQLAILAWGGYGKTTLLKHIAYIYATKKYDRYGVPKRIPVLLAFRKYRDLLSQDEPPSLPVLIAQYHIPSLPEGADLKVPENWAQEMLRNGKAVVMLDGFDEIPRAKRPAVARWVLAQMQRYRKSVFIVTARPKAYKEQDPGDRLTLTTLLWVQDFKADQRKDFVERWYLCQERYAHGGRKTPDVQQGAKQAAAELLTQIEARQELRDLAKNPLLLNMIATFHRRFPSAELPRRRVELYKEICLLQLRDRPGARKLETVLTQCEAQTILQCLALHMMQQRLERVDRVGLLQLFNQFLTEQREMVSPKVFLEQVVQISELLVEREPDEFEFSHLSFQEYLAATHIVQQRQESLLYDHLVDDWWKPIILLYAAQTDATALIKKAIQQDLTDLAYACLKETTKPIDRTIETEILFSRNLETAKKMIQTVRYRKLKEYLQNKKWQAADQETYRLMIAIIGKEEGQPFDPEDLQNFPCDELRTIDTLWVAHSDGRFGFSAQKQIWEKCNCPKDNIEDWQLFAQKVGWHTDGKFQGYNNLKFTMNSDVPLGYLPARPFFAYFTASGGGAVLLNVLDYKSGFSYIFYYLFAAQLE